MQQLEIRQAIAGDIGWIISRHGEIYFEQFQLASEFEIDIARKMVAISDQENHFNRILLAIADGHRIGCIAISLKDPETAFINFVLVTSQFRGQGVAHQLMDAVIQHANTNGISSIQLETYRFLEAARKLYQRYGFEIYQINSGLSKYGRVFDQEFWQLKLI